MRIAPLLLTLTLSFAAFSADVTGKWNVTARHPDGDDIKATMVIQTENGKLVGSIGTSEGTSPLTDVEFKDNILTCKLMYGDTPVTIKMTLEADKLKGNYNTDDGNSGPIEAVRAAEIKAIATAPAAGVWKIDTSGPDGNALKVQLTLKIENGSWSGEIVVEEYGMTITLEDVKVDGENVSLKAPTDNGTYTVTGKVSGDKFEGTSLAPDGTKNKFSGTRQAA